MNTVGASTYLHLLQVLSSVLHDSEYRSFISLVRFIPRYFIYFDATAHGIVFLVSLSDSSFLVYKNATDFSTLIFILLLNSVISSSKGFFFGRKNYQSIFRILYIQYPVVFTYTCLLVEITCTWYNRWHPGCRRLLHVSQVRGPLWSLSVGTWRCLHPL